MLCNKRGLVTRLTRTKPANSLEQSSALKKGIITPPPTPKQLEK